MGVREMENGVSCIDSALRRADVASEKELPPLELSSGPELSEFSRIANREAELIGDPDATLTVVRRHAEETLVDSDGRVLKRLVQKDDSASSFPAHGGTCCAGAY
jgi:hypothetical protein